MNEGLGLHACTLMRPPLLLIGWLRSMDQVRFPTGVEVNVGEVCKEASEAQ